MSDQSPLAPHPLPTLTKLGLATIGFGLLFDLSEHGFFAHPNDPTIGAFPIAEHLAHLVVIVGMVCALAGIVADGIRLSRGRVNRPERSDSRAHR